MSNNETTEETATPAAAGETIALGHGFTATLYTGDGINVPRQFAVKKMIHSVHGRRLTFRLAPATPKITGPAADAPRPIAQATAALAALAAKGADDRCRQAIGRELIRGWRVRATDGHMAVMTPTTAADPDRDTGRRPMFPDPLPLVTLAPAVWLAYARVRVCRNDRSDAVQWAIEPGQLALAAGPDDDGASARETVTLPPAPDLVLHHQLRLSDRYVWPCRGIGWQLAVTGDCVILTAGETAIAIMGMRA